MKTDLSMSILHTGFYVNVNSTNSKSNFLLRLLYDKAWRGINIEEDEGCFKKNVTDRPEDINLNLIISDFNGFIDTDCNKGSLPYRSLDVILDECEVEEIHFLNININQEQGKKILEGLFLTDLCPHAILIEFEDDLTSLDWENKILEKGYDSIALSKKIRVYIYKKFGAVGFHSQFLLNLINDVECFKCDDREELMQLDVKEERIEEQEDNLKKQNFAFFENMQTILKKLFKNKKCNEKRLDSKILCSLKTSREKSNAEKLFEEELSQHLLVHYFKK